MAGRHLIWVSDEMSIATASCDKDR